mgnify:CR=1 FL=1
MIGIEKSPEGKEVGIKIGIVGIEEDLLIQNQDQFLDLLIVNMKISIIKIKIIMKKEERSEKDQDLIQH